MLPRWTVYPSLLLLIGLGITLIPKKDDESYSGAAAAKRGEDVVAPERFEHPPMIVLGVDGLDPDLLAAAIERYPEALPNFRWLSEQASGILPLITSTPPQSPVAWSNFITGRDPGGHGIFDFIHRDPVTRGVLAPTVTSEEGSTIGLPGEWIVPLGGSSDSNRKGRSFWEILEGHGVPADIWRIPVNFPVEPSMGVSFPGMMTPVLDGGYGGATLYTTEAFVRDSGFKKVTIYDDKIDTNIEGPKNMFKEPSARPVTIPLKIYLDRESNAAALDVGSEVVVLRAGEWSDFVPVSFDMLPMGTMAYGGITRFYLRQIEPEFEMYMAPINFDPAAPVTPVSEPADASVELAEAIGPYYTQGMAEDVGALKDALLTDAEFLSQVDLVYHERNRMLEYAIDEYLEGGEGGLLFFYYSTVDLTSHMMWRHSDPEHPGYEADVARTPTKGFSGRDDSSFATVIYDVIIKTDAALGRLRERVGDDAMIVVMSDHGFAPHRRKFNLNAWLLREGYLVLREGYDGDLAEGNTHIFDKYFEGEGDDKVMRTVVDWSKTKAYGLGFNGLYLNLEGREKDDDATEDVESGIVKPDEADALLREIASELEALTDPKDGTQVVLRCDIASEVYSNDHLEQSPDIVVGYNAGYGNSDEDTQGRIPPAELVLEDNIRGTFNGSHLMAPEVVSGTLLSNRTVRPGDHRLEDLTVAILRHYGIEPDPDDLMKGHPVFE